MEASPFDSSRSGSYGVEFGLKGYPTRLSGFFFTPAGAAYLSSYHGCCQWAWPYTTDRWVLPLHFRVQHPRVSWYPRMALNEENDAKASLPTVRQTRPKFSPRARWRTANPQGHLRGWKRHSRASPDTNNIEQSFCPRSDHPYHKRSHQSSQAGP